jgi:hypothetical protein
MVSIYEEIEIEDMTFNSEDQTFYYPCPCGDKFGISLEELMDGEDIAHCPSCTLKLRVICDEEYLAKFEVSPSSGDEKICTEQ